MYNRYKAVYDDDNDFGCYLIIRQTKTNNNHLIDTRYFMTIQMMMFDILNCQEVIQIKCSYIFVCYIYIDLFLQQNKSDCIVLLFLI